MNIRTKLTIVLTIILMLGFGVFLILSYKNAAGILRTQLVVNGKMEANLKIGILERFLNEKVVAVDILNTSLEKTQDKDANLEDLLDQFVKTAGDFQSAFLVDESGNAAIGKSPDDRDIVAAALNNLKSGNYISISGNSLFITQIIKNQDRFIVATLPLSALTSFVSYNTDRSEAIISVDGTIIAAPTKQTENVVKNNWDGIKSAGMNAFHENAEELFFISQFSPEAVKELQLYWKFVSIKNKSMYLQEIENLKTKLTSYFIIILVACLVLVFILARGFVQPIKELSQLAAKIAMGDLKTDIPITSNDELGKLAQELNNTAHAINSRIEQEKSLALKLEDQKWEMFTAKEKLEESHNQITDSISYAKRLQRSMLPDVRAIDRLVKGAFVFYQPKDVVSGDFYWFERVRKGRHDYLVIACADCTGHGVPGAIMSIMGGNQLTNIVYYQNYLEPKKIIARLDKNIKFELYRDDEEQESSFKDGMEIGICVINLDDYSMEYAGAGVPLYHYSDGEIKIYKPVKEMAGGFNEQEERDVENKIVKEEIFLKKGDRIFMASDGFQDQFGGEEDKKFMAKNFRELILNTCSLPLEEQHFKLRDSLKKWKGNMPQTDDILVMGFEF